MASNEIHGQISLFDGENKFIIDKPIRLIELFAGYGSQHLALKYLGADFESWHICEWAVKSIQAYKDIHFADDNTDYSKELAFDEVVDFLHGKGISANYNDPMSREKINRMGEAKCRQVYNNIKATGNLVSVTNVKADDLEITDTDKFCYMLTYSFPCQDLSKAGKKKGMKKGSGTRSGLLWEVERILDECTDLPQVLLMENVPDVIGTKNAKHFAEWEEKLRNLGYKNYWSILNGKNFEIPQNRDRCFMVSFLGDYYYEFPKPVPLKLRLKDILEESVADKYYITVKNPKWSENHNEKDIKVNQVAQIYPNSGNPQAGRIYNGEGLSPSLDTCTGGNRMPKIIEVGKLYENRNSSTGNSILDTDGICSALDTMGGGNRETKIVEPTGCTLFESEEFGGLKIMKDGVSSTVRSSKASAGVIEPVLNSNRVRKLTPGYF